MAENNDVPEVSGGDPTTEAEAVPNETANEAVAAGPVLVPRIRDRVWSFRAMLAVGIAALLIGGAGGAAVVAATGHDDDRPRIGRFGGPDGRFGGLDGQRGPGGGQGFRQNGPGGNGPSTQQNNQENNQQDAPDTQPAPPATSGGSTS